MKSFQMTEHRRPIESVVTLLHAIDDLHAVSKLWYRGHAKISYSLIPSIAREQRYAGKPRTLGRDDEWQLLHRFRRRAHPFVGRNLSPIEALFIARHHALPTRLLDWTGNLLVALFFACTEAAQADGRLWAFEGPETSADIDVFDLVNHTRDAEFLKQMGEQGIRILYPFHNTPRLPAQEGIFTIHPNPWRPLDCYRQEPFKDGQLEIKHLHSWTIPSDRKFSILRQLSQLGASRRMAYPDLDGIAASLWETQILWLP